MVTKGFTMTDFIAFILILVVIAVIINSNKKD